MSDTGALETGGPKTIEQIAMEKVTDPFSEPHPFYHTTFVGKLEEILGEGLMGENFANRIGKGDFHKRRSLDASWNRKYVSLRGYGSEGPALFSPLSVAILVSPRDEVIHATSEHGQSDERIYPQGDESLVRNRIAPREFVGIQIQSEEARKHYRDEYQDSDVFVTIFRQLDPSRSLPIFDKDGLVWPVKMTREQLKDYVQSKV